MKCLRTMSPINVAIMIMTPILTEILILSIFISCFVVCTPPMQHMLLLLGEIIQIVLPCHTSLGYMMHKFVPYVCPVSLFTCLI